MMFGGKRGEICSWLAIAGVLGSLASCSSNHAEDAAAGSANGGASSSGGPGASNLGGESAGGGANSAGTGSDGASGAGSSNAEPSSCLGLERDPASSPFYTPTDATANVFVAGTFQDGRGLLLAVAVDRSLRIVAVDESGAATELLNEAEYKPNWPFDPAEVFAIRTKDGVDLLVTDNAEVGLVHKQGSKVTVTPLDETSYMDLHVLGFAPTAAGTLAFYWKGDRADGTDEKLTAVDVTTMDKATREFHGDSGLVLTPSQNGAWLSAERLDFAADCQATGEMVNCGGGTTPVPTSTCTWHLDVWNVADASFATADPLTTFDAPATISPRCSDKTPAGLATYSSTLGYGYGVGSHHAAVLNQRTQGLGLALQRPLGPGMPGVQFELLEPSGTRKIDGTTAPLFATASRSWMAVRADNLFFCGDDECAMSDAAAGTGFRLPSVSQSVSALGVALRPDGLALIGNVNGNPLLQQLLRCKH